MPEPGVEGSAVERWFAEAGIHERAGDYAWLAERLPGRRVLEVGCGAGLGSLAILAQGAKLLVVEPLAECRDALAARLAATGRAASVTVIAGEVGTLGPEALETLGAFAPDCVVCWLAGGSAAQLAECGAAGAADPVKAFRESLHRQVARLAASLPGVAAVQIADRTAFPWHIKDTARDALVGYHRGSTFADLPFAVDRGGALFRKLDVGRWSRELQRRGGMTPVLGSLVARRTP
jgi:hypothetical protein